MTRVAIAFQDGGVGRKSVTDDVLTRALPAMSGTASRVLLALSSRSGRDGVVEMRHTELMALLRAGRRSIQRALCELESFGLVASAGGSRYSLFVQTTRKNAPPVAPSTRKNAPCRARSSGGREAKVAENNGSNTRRRRPCGYTVAFEQWYAAYPRRVGKGAAFRAYQQAVAAVGARVEDADGYLLERARLFAGSPAGRAGQYTPYPATWLNAGRYDDDLAEWRRSDSRSRIEIGAGQRAEADRVAEDGTF